jgi:Domain of unknown function (DUF5615)
MSVRFQADADFNHIIVKAMLRREPSMDFQTAHAAGLVGVPDPEVLALAAHAGRVLVTHDRQTMPTHFAAFIGHTNALEPTASSLRSSLVPASDSGSGPTLDLSIRSASRE